jgi:hypothetical protein
MTPLPDALERAVDLLLQAGFEFRYQSRKTEARYYGLPGREAVLRVASHRHHRSSARRGLPLIAGRITLSDGGCQEPGHVNLSNGTLHRQVATAIGSYMLRSGATVGTVPT